MRTDVEVRRRLVVGAQLPARDGNADATALHEAADAHRLGQIRIAVVDTAPAGGLTAAAVPAIISPHHLSRVPAMTDSTSGDGASGPRRQRRGIFLLPNLFTTAALFAGFYAIVAGMGGRFEAASAAIFIAMVLDGADGRIARLTNTQSAFGAEYDSLSDVISFGLAPGLLVYEWALSGMGTLGWLPRSSIRPRRRCGSPGSTPSSGPPTSATSRGCRARPRGG